MTGTSPSQASRAPSGGAIYGNKVPRREVRTFHQFTCLVEGEIIAIVTVGIDLAKNVFAVDGVDETGKPALVRP